MSDTPAPDANDDITDEELAAALALIKKRRADAARQQEQTQQATVPVLGTSYPPAVAKPLATPLPRKEGGEEHTPSALSAPPSLRSPVSERGKGVGGLGQPHAALRSSGTLALAGLVPSELPAPVVGECPDCKRKLLTRTSALCNWCGAKINNDDYQEQAARTRQEMDAAVRDAAAARAQESTERGLLNRLKRRIKPGDTSNKAPQT